MPPNDLDAEAAVLSAVLLSQDVMGKIRPILLPEHFYSDANRKIYEAFCDLAFNSRPIDILTTRSWLSDHDLLNRCGGSTYLAQILDSVPAISNVEEYARLIVDKWRMRQVIATCQRVAAEGYGQVEDVSQFIANAESELFQLASTNDVSVPKTIKDVLLRRYATLEQRLKEGTSNMVLTGLPEVDAMIVGLSPGDFCVIGARPGRGKTSFGMNNITTSTAQRGMGVGFFSLEMGEGQLGDRLVCSDAKVNSRNIVFKKLDDWEKKRLVNSYNTVSALPIVVDDEPGIMAPTMLLKARRMASILAEQGKQLKLVVVDYLQLMGGDPKVKSREERVGMNAWALKNMAKTMGIVVVALAQLNRESEKRGKDSRPQLSDLRESGAVEQHADQVIFLHSVDRDKDDESSQQSNKRKYDGGDGKLGADEAEIIVAKNRHFGTGVARVGWSKVFTRFETKQTPEEQAAAKEPAPNYQEPVEQEPYEDPAAALDDEFAGDWNR